jgi:translation elongation factor EF-4
MRVMDGAVKRGDAIRFLNSRAEHDVIEVGIMQPNQVPVDCLRAGEVGYLCASIRDVLDARVGDTIVLSSEYKAAAKLLMDSNNGSIGNEDPIPPLPGYQVAVPMVFCGIFPVDADQYENLRDALGKMRLNDAAITYEPETSGAMGFGFRCGFLGLLHMDVVRERLEREYDLDLIVTAPTVVYKVRCHVHFS